MLWGAFLNHCVYVAVAYERTNEHIMHTH